MVLGRSGWPWVQIYWLGSLILMVGNGFWFRFDCSGWFWVVLGPDLIVGVLNFMVGHGFGFRFDGPGLFWVVLGPELMVGVLDFYG